MTEPTQAVKEMEFTYAVDQQVSVNAFFDVELNGEVVKFQITSRYNSSADKIVKTTKAAIEAFIVLRSEYAKPAQSAPAPRQESNGEPKKFELKPVAQNELPEGLPAGIEVYADEFDEIEIIPTADGKVTVSFFKDKLEFPIGAKMNKWKVENAAQSLQVLGEYDFTKAQKVRAAGVQYWSKGNEYVISQGARKGEKSHYKDLRLIQARF